MRAVAATRAAIRVNNFSIERAIDWCLSHSDDPDFNEPSSGCEMHPSIALSMLIEDPSM